MLGNSVKPYGCPFVLAATAFVARLRRRRKAGDMPFGSCTLMRLRERCPAWRWDPHPG